MIYAFISLLIVLTAMWYFPFWKKEKALLPVLLYPKINPAGKPPFINPKKLEKQFLFLLKKGFTPVFPPEIPQSGLPRDTAHPRPVILVFYGGYQSFYQQVFPLLKKLNIKAVLGVPVGLIGQYNAWENPHKIPWQNLCTLEQLREMHKSGLVDLASHGLDFADLNALSPSAFVAQAAESKHRMQAICHLPLHTFAFSKKPSKNLAEEVLKAGYLSALSPENGLNTWPLPEGNALKTISICSHTLLTRLYFKMTR